MSELIHFLSNIDIRSVSTLFFLPLILGIIGSVIGNFVSPIIKNWYAQSSAEAAKARIQEIESKIDEVQKYKKNSVLLYQTALREVLRAVWYFLTCGLALVIVVAITVSPITFDLYITRELVQSVQAVGLAFIWMQLTQSLSRVTWAYRLVRDTIDFEEFIERQEQSKKFYLEIYDKEN